MIFLLALSLLPGYPGGEVQGTAEERAAVRKAMAQLKSLPSMKPLEKRRRALDLDFRVVVSTAVKEPYLGHMNWGRPPLVIVSTRVFASTGALLADTLAHELYGHALIQAELLAAKAPVDDLLHLAECESLSRVIGSLASCELGSTPLSEDPWLVGEGTVAYHAQLLFSESPDKLNYTRCEAQDVVAATDARLIELERRAGQLERWRLELAWWSWFFDHQEKKHGMPAAKLANLRAHLADWEKSVQERRKFLEPARPHHLGIRGWLDGEEGRAWAASMAASALHPAAWRLERQLAEYGARAAGCVARLEAAGAGAPGEPQWTWDDAQAAVDADPARHKKKAPPLPAEPSGPYRLPDGGHLSRCGPDLTQVKAQKTTRR